MKRELAGFKTEIILGNSKSYSKLGKVYIIDGRLQQLYSAKISTIVGNNPFLALEAAEENKNLESLQNILDFFLKNEVTRQDTVVAVGGGIVTDITALAGSLYLRGCQLALIPTTLLAMVDAAVGGKTAINFRGYKNNLGSFYPANKIILDMEFLSSLPTAEFDNGYIEIKKMALLANNGLLEMIIDEAPLVEIIEKAIVTKLDFCQQDLKDRGVRRYLNLGHTFAHVIETASNFNISHGLAVAKGILLAASYSVFLEKMPEVELKKIYDLFTKYKLPEFTQLNFTTFQEIIGKDKKKGQDVNLVLLKSIYQPFIYSETNLKSLYNFIYKI